MLTCPTAWCKLMTSRIVFSVSWTPMDEARISTRQLTKRHKLSLKSIWNSKIKDFDCMKPVGTTNLISYLIEIESPFTEYKYKICLWSQFDVSRSLFGRQLTVRLTFRSLLSFSRKANTFVANWRPASSGMGIWLTCTGVWFSSSFQNKAHRE
jgi:hypothetical protein